MLRGYRLYIVALGLALACANHAYAEGSKQQPQAEQSKAKSLSDIAAANHQESERAKRANQDEAPCGEGKYGSSADLCAQWKAADSASDSAWWAWVAAISTIVSTAAVLVAIGLTYQSNNIARNTAKRQLRAYMEVAECTIGIYPDDGEIIMQIWLENCGQTPAQDASIMSESFVGPYPLEGEQPIVRLEEDGWTMPVGPGKSIACARRLFVNDVNAALEDAKAKRGAFYIQGVCEYTDAFGERRETGFRYAFAGIVSTNGLVMQAAKTGNYST